MDISRQGQWAIRICLDEMTKPKVPSQPLHTSQHNDNLSTTPNGTEFAREQRPSASSVARPPAPGICMAEARNTHGATRAIEL